MNYGTFNIRMYVIFLNAYIYIWVILLKTGQNCDIEDKNSKYKTFLCYYLEMKD